MDALYRRNGGAPAPLPFDAFDAGNDHWTNLAENAEGRAACGFVEAPPVPAFDPGAEAVRWDEAGEAWVIEALPPPPAPPPATLVDVEAERDRRIALGVPYLGHLFQTRPQDFDNLRDMASTAIAAIMAGAQPGDLRWADADVDFTWIDAANVLVPMDAPTALRLHATAAAMRGKLFLVARAIKNALLGGAPITDVADDALWAPPAAA